MTTDSYRIRKYPNRRLYDTRRSKFITSKELFAIMCEGNRVQVTDSATGGDITNIVLINTVIACDPARILSIPAEALQAMVGGNGGTPSGAAARASSGLSS